MKAIAIPLVFFAMISGLPAQEIVGSYDLSDAEGSRKCRLEVKDKGRLEASSECAAAFPRISKAAQWAVKNGAFSVQDSAGRTLLRLSEVESGVYETRIEGEGILFLQPASVSQSFEPVRPEEFFGEWFLQRGGNRVCRVILMSEKTGSSYALKTKPDCERSITQINLMTWQITNRTLELVGKMASLKFEAAEEGSWRTSGNAATALNLTRSETP